MKLLCNRIPCQSLVILLAGTFLASAAQADFFLGGSLGTATIDIGDFDQDDNSWKLFGGYQFDLPAVEFGIEGGYIDLGSPSSNLGSIDTTALDIFAVVGFDFTVVGIFGKAGLVSWDADINDGGFQYSDDGSDSAYGVGIKFAIASLALRIEYEKFDIQDTDDVNLFSVGMAWHF